MSNLVLGILTLAIPVVVISAYTFFFPSIVGRNGLRDHLLKTKLQKLAAQKAWSDEENFNLQLKPNNGYLRGAYARGQEDGEILLARNLLKEYFGE